MKKFTVLIMSVILCLFFASCNEKISIKFPFESSDVEQIEMFHYFNPAEAEKKIITNSEDIENIYNVFEGISLKDKATEPVAGGSATSFRFYLSDGTSYEIIYSEIAVKSGRIKTTGMEKDYFTSANIGASWKDYNYETINASEDELPSLYSKQNSEKPEYDVIPMVMVNNKLYYDTGKESSIDGRCGVMDGEITSTVDGSQIPTENNQSNFGTGFEYQYGANDTIEIFMNGKWIVFEHREGTGSQVRFGNRMVNADKLSKETIEWLAWYNSLSEEQQKAISYIPPDLYDEFDFADTEDADAPITE